MSYMYYFFSFWFSEFWEIFSVPKDNVCCMDDWVVLKFSLQPFSVNALVVLERADYIVPIC